MRDLRALNLVSNHVFILRATSHHITSALRFVGSRVWKTYICCTGACLWYASMRGTCIVCARVSVQTCAHVKIKFQEKNGTWHVFYPIAIVCWFCVFAVNYVFVYNLYITVCVCMYLYVVVYPFVTGRYSCVTRMYSYVARMYPYVTQMYSYVFVCYSHVVLVTIIVSMPLISMRRRITDENKQGWLNSMRSIYSNISDGMAFRYRKWLNFNVQLESYSVTTPWRRKAVPCLFSFLIWQFF